MEEWEMLERIVELEEIQNDLLNRIRALEVTVAAQGGK